MAIDRERITLGGNIVKQTWPHHSGRVEVCLPLALLGITSLPTCGLTQVTKKASVLPGT
ncbi:hypothetical protein [Amycolatopsis sp. lyj-112]|uniref:hypothetical protein n=1 Tax=Amycolatopsis sp. lyj-112 TaxID=2789288 RepID=UPI00397BD199